MKDIAAAASQIDSTTELDANDCQEYSNNNAVSTVMFGACTLHIICPHSLGTSSTQ